MKHCKTERTTIFRRLFDSMSSSFPHTLLVPSSLSQSSCIPRKTCSDASVIFAARFFSRFPIDWASEQLAHLAREPGERERGSEAVATSHGSWFIDFRSILRVTEID